MNLQSPPTYKYLNELLSAISKMDDQALDDLLHDEYIYFGASKFIILSKFRELFDVFIKNGDVILEYYTGNCNGSCESKGDQGFLFVGNSSRDYFKLLFKELDVDYIDFRSCSRFKTQQGLLLNKERGLSLFRNEKANIYTYPHLKDKMKLAEKAIKERLDFPPVFDYQIYHVWVEKYLSLGEQIDIFDYDYSFLEEFKDLFDPLDEFSKAFKMEPLYKKANIEYQALNVEDEKAIADWLEKYDEMGNELLCFIYLDEEEGFLTHDNLICVNENLTVVHEYKELEAFKLNFYRHYVFPDIPSQEEIEIGGFETEEDGGGSWYNV